MAPHNPVEVPSWAYLLFHRQSGAGKIRKIGNVAADCRFLLAGTLFVTLIMESTDGTVHDPSDGLN